MRIFVNMLFGLATTILMLHSIIPHQHHSEISIVEDEHEHKSADGFLDLLSLALHTDQGDGHLENFTTGDQVELDDLSVENDVNSDDHYAVISENSTPSIVSSKSIRRLVSHEDFNYHVDRSTDLTRGPPHVELG